jgi:hypothetical protein
MYYVCRMKSPAVFGKGIIVGVGRLALPADLDHARWCEIGADLRRLDRAVAWRVGDWWAFGEHRYGALREITEDPGWQGPAYQTCANAAAVCRAFEASRRRETLSFSRHETVAALAPAEQDRWLDEADREGWTRRELRAAVHSTKRPVVRSLKSPTHRSVTVAMTTVADWITVPWIAARVSDAASSTITYVPPPVPWVTPRPLILDQPPLTSPDPTKDYAPAAECELAHFLEQFANSYGAIRGFAPVIERLREAQMMLSKIVL